MTITTMLTGDDISEAETPLLNDVVPGSVDFKSRPSVRSKSGAWKSAFFVIGVSMAERFVYSGISSNLMSYLTGTLGQSTAAAAANLNAWYGTASLLPILGAFVADSFLGRYRTVIFSTLLYIMGLGFLSLSAALNSWSKFDCKTAENTKAWSLPILHKIFFFFSLYLVAIGQGGHLPCLLSFGADQFDLENEKENVSKSSFFNWFMMFSCSGVLLGYIIMNYIQDSLNWVLGFGIPCFFMCFSLVIFLVGSSTYRFPITRDKKRPSLVRSRSNISFRLSKRVENEEEIVKHEEGSSNLMLKLVPIWCTLLGYSIVYAQPATLFTKQAAAMDRYVTSTFQIPAATFQSFIIVSIIVGMAFYDRVLVPVASKMTKMPSGITTLQRIGTGLFISLSSVVFAALVEKRRLGIAAQNGTGKLSVWWLVPQYALSGIADVFAMVGLEEFFYDQVPSELKTTGIALYLSVLGIGSLLSCFLVSLIQSVTGFNGRDGWFSDDLDRAHLDYFYWLLAGISAFAFAGYVYFSKSYVYTRRVIA